ncbi:Na+/H+ antiporter NhaA [Leifsonia sp. H3M29-4]|uniref:Na+/H+ antiporter NhaA n=1 Tax=Salinibacterium metalliresistens TaxID=3031321 RepID=UPI0023DB70D4|nr:Na+/H+ antiporter NhaA [Salinibacterium metalliresistens]MDF1479769.1 Na+/H+ antiporter NhaA [Salinibacterium metalliresistens]
MQLLRSDRFAAMLLVAAAALGLILANSPLGDAARAVETFHIGAGPIDLSVGHWIKDGLLAIFFFIAAIELRHELRHGELDTAGKALVPTAAAVGGVVAPAIIFLIIVRDGDLAQGWPIPTATDIAFALGVLAIVGRSLPARFRALLLAIAVIDDLIAIIIIAAFFTRDLQPLPLLAAIPLVLMFGWLSYRMRRGAAPWLLPLLIVIGLATWVLVFLSGIHPTIAGVALGLVMSDATGQRTRRAIEPWSNAVILPLFAIVAALVPIPQASITELSPAFWGVIVAMPVGKLVGITVGALIAIALAGRRSKQQRMPLPDIIAIAALGGIGFTVSLLMNELAYEPQPEVADEVTLAVLLASVIAAIIGGALTAVRGRHYTRLSQSQTSAR